VILDHREAAELVIGRTISRGPVGSAPE